MARECTKDIYKFVINVIEKQEISEEEVVGECKKVMDTYIFMTGKFTCRKFPYEIELSKEKGKIL